MKVKNKLPDISSSGRAADRRMCRFYKLKLRLVEAHDRVLVVEEGLVNVVGNENQKGPTREHRTGNLF